MYSDLYIAQPKAILTDMETGRFGCMHVFIKDDCNKSEIWNDLFKRCVFYCQASCLWFEVRNLPQGKRIQEISC